MRRKLFAILILCIIPAVSEGTARADDDPILKCNEIKPSPPVTYLTKAQHDEIVSQIPKPPEGTLDKNTFVNSRFLLSTPIGYQAAYDDVYKDEQIAPIFSRLLGNDVEITKLHQPQFFRLLTAIRDDATSILDELKKANCRRRPMLDMPDTKLYPTCISPDLVANGYVDEKLFSLSKTPSYPSGHSVAGMIWGLVLSDLVADLPKAHDVAARVAARGLVFGESRVICGFHYPSDVTAGQLLATEVVQKLRDQPDIKAMWDAARSEIHTLVAP